EYMHSLRPEDNPDKGDPMKVTMNYPTINWSLSGMLLGEYDPPDDVKPDMQLRGIIRTEKSQESGIFTAKVVRANPVRRTLALAFTSLSSELFDMLEAGIKKHPPIDM
ncbi:PilZ domain-containing protein, partial [Elstera litoralis]